MGLKGRLVSEFELRSCANKFHNIWCKEPHSISNVSDVAVACELHEGEYGKTGSIICWNYIQDGKKLSSKEKITVDEENRKTVFTVIEGELLDEYKSFVTTLHVTDEGNGIDLVKWTIDYEKLADTVPIPTAIMGVIVACSEHIETHHLNNA